VVLQRIRHTVALVQFAKERFPHYGPLVSGDLRRFRDEIVRATVGASVAMVAGLFFACFLSIAVIVSTWDGPYRTVSAWLVCSMWGLLAVLALRFARKAVISEPPPFHLVGTALARDYGHLAEMLSTDATSQETQ